jgi:phosphoglycerol transferase MdoB-like AlkP superfamily enzyme
MDVGFLGLLIPAFFIRFKVTKGIHFLGFLQDCLLCSLCLLIPYPYLKIFCMIFLQLFVVIDAFVFRQIGLRLEAPFVLFIKDMPHYWSSAKERGILLLIPLLIVTSAVTGYLASIATPPFFMWLFLGGLFLPKRSFYQSSHPLFLCLSYYVYRFLPLKEGAMQEGFLGRHFTPQNEKYTLVSPDYPLLKMTEGFTGEKRVPIEIASGEKPHVLLVIMESFRSKDLNEKNAPRFMELMKKGVYFPRFYSNSVKTSRALTSIIFGIPSDVDGEDLSNQVDFPLISLADILNQKGYNTAYFHNGPLEFENQMQLCANHGFKVIHGKNEIFMKYQEAPMTSWGVPDEYLMKYTANYLSESTSSQFITLFTMSNHHPWICPDSFNPGSFDKECSKTYQRYLSTYRYSDYSLGLLVDELKRTDLLKNTVLLILGDHGQPMGEHEMNFIEQKCLYEENVHVPFLIYAEGRLNKSQVVDTLASQIDIVPTVMDLLHVGGLNHAVGSSLLREVSRSQLFFHNPFVFKFFGTYSDNYKLIYTKTEEKTELYDLKKDPGEKFDLSRELPELSNSLLEDVKQYEAHFTNLYRKHKFAPPQFCNENVVVDLSREKPFCLKNHSYILDLNLSYRTDLTDDLFISLIRGHPELKKLSIAQVSTLTEKSIQALIEHCPSLTHLNLAYCLLLGDQAVSSIFNKLHHLESLVFNDLDEITDQVFIDIEAPRPMLLSLRCEGCMISDRGLFELIKKMPHLQKLYLSAENLSEEGMVEFFKHFIHLEELELYDCDHLTDRVMSSLLAHQYKLRHLRLNGAALLSDSSLERLVTSSVQNLFLKGAHQITDGGLTHLAKAKLRLLSFENCHQVTERGIQFIKDHTTCIKMLTFDNSRMVSRHLTYDI